MDKKYKHLFFDLDRTLWDFEKNCSETLLEIFDHFRLGQWLPAPNLFAKTYHRHNDYLWECYKNRKITKDFLREERFRLTLAEFGIKNHPLCSKINAFYMQKSPTKPNLIDGATDTLNYLSNKYLLYIISNGFLNTQLAKLKSAGIESYFTKVFTSEVAQSAKPDKVIFDYSIKSSNARKLKSLMIGDDLSNDILGARSAGIDQVWFNPKRLTSSIPPPTFVIERLIELKELL